VPSNDPEVLATSPRWTGVRVSQGKLSIADPEKKCLKIAQMPRHVFLRGGYKGMFTLTYPDVASMRTSSSVEAATASRFVRRLLMKSPAAEY
jgi:hypothetical protein